MIRMTLDWSSVIQIIHCNVGLKCSFSVLPECLFVIIIIYAYFIDISHGSVETHSWSGGNYNDHTSANCLQIVPVKEF